VASVVAGGEGEVWRIMKDNQSFQLDKALDSLKYSECTIPLSSEDIVKLMGQHLMSPYSRQLQILVVAAAYKVAEQNLGEHFLPLQALDAIDLPMQSFGDLPMAHIDDYRGVTVYELKAKRVEKEDINVAIEKVKETSSSIDHYIFITTDEINLEVKGYAASMYKLTAGIEFVILDCIGFIRHFLQLFYRIRIDFLDAYQDSLFAEPKRAVPPGLKVSFLALRRLYESEYSSDETTGAVYNLELPLNE